MKIEKKNKDGVIEIVEEHSYISRAICINYIKGPDEEKMVEMVWWGKFDHLKNDTPPEEIIKWCQENCNGLIYFNYQSYSAKFELEEDVMAFKLRWM